jgi:LacI family transcriptional regulator
LRATIKDVAQASGVSIKTVSRVLNKQPRVSEKARKSVQQAIETLNFRPSAAARSLVGHRTFQIALACDNPSPFYVHEMQAGIHERCRQDGVRMIAQPYDHRAEGLIEEIASLIDTTGIDGLILTPPISDRQDILDLLARREVSYVRVTPSGTVETSAVFIDNQAAANAMTRHLLALGHQRIGFVMGHPSYAGSVARHAGYVAALVESGRTPDPKLVREGGYDFASGAAAAEALLALADAPTAIFASNDEMAAGVLSVAHRRGMAVPGALSVAGFGDDALASFVWPPLTTIRQPTRQMGFQAADLLLAPAQDKASREVPFELIRRESTGGAPRR